jgi:hypothetical protein
MTTLSYNDIITQGSTIGFYPDTPGAWLYIDSNATYNVGGVPTNQGQWVCNNDLSHSMDEIGSFVSSTSSVFLPANGGVGGNFGLTKRISYINFNPNVVPNGSALQPTYAQVGITALGANQVWKSYIYNQQNSVAGAGAASGIMQIAVMATIYLKHIHSFFNMVPLLKGAFMKLTMNLNNNTTSITLNAAGAVTAYASNTFVGGVNPLHIPSGRTGSGSPWAAGAIRTITYNLSVGSVVTDESVRALAVTNLPVNSPLSKSIYLYVPAYTFNYTFEQAYLSVSPKIIKYTDIYQYQVLGVGGFADSGQFNNLITNGIANIKSVLIIPFYATTSNTYGNGNYAEYLSPFDPAGCGATAPLVTLGNFNIQISGQNAIYNMQRYTFEEFNNQLYGQYAVNGGLTDGLTSGLIDFDAFQKSACYYYVNVERMLPVEQSVPKSVQVLGTNYSTKPLNMWVFIEYGVQVSIDILTGARV